MIRAVIAILGHLLCLDSKIRCDILYLDSAFLAFRFFHLEDGEVYFYYWRGG